ncbi:putative secreted protein [Litoreibacter meonggei]|uniref:Putative secreted protein n=1 Tax=Litoreibacter meonggei TaxID=1049199 RepID=A0A497VDF3_9RHOB|nr:VPLPA-CTERM sorting domain-containing protein [Litoreibacter meonggei]RLJ36199.1 putative secreted protein [Litoreibacter meonggei]
MKNFLKLTTTAAVLTVAGSLSASAALIDFSATGTGFSGSLGSNNWTLTGFPVAPNTDETGRGPVGVIAGDNDGVGIDNDEVTAPSEYLTLTFDRNVRLVGSYFLDLFIARTGLSHEVANITVGAVPGAVAAFKDADDVFPTQGGYAELENLSLVGTQFTFFASLTNDDIGKADFALAAVEVAPVPLPAGFLLLGTALGGLGVARRRKQRKAA